MGYRVNYQKNGKNTHGVRLIGFTILCLILFFLTVHCCWPEGAAYIQRRIISAKETLIAASLDRFAGNLFTGEPLTEAFSQFCNDLQS